MRSRSGDRSVEAALITGTLYTWARDVPKIAAQAREDHYAARTLHDAGAPAGALVHRDAGRGRGEGAVRRPPRLRRDVARRALFGRQRADPLAADVHGEPRAAHQPSEIRHRGDLSAEP